jgi:hypothetical protein
VIKTKNKTERTNVEFPSKNVSIMNSMMNQKEMHLMMDEQKFTNISDAENEIMDSDKYYNKSS